jgi:hypothetical protein
MHVCWERTCLLEHAVLSPTPPSRGGSTSELASGSQVGTTQGQSLAGECAQGRALRTHPKGFRAQRVRSTRCTPRASSALMTGGRGERRSRWRWFANALFCPLATPPHVIPALILRSSSSACRSAERHARPPRRPHVPRSDGSTPSSVANALFCPLATPPHAVPALILRSSSTCR